MEISPDENLYSRQMAALGAETQSKLIQMKILISGLTGIGIETAKNLILAGPKQVTIHDDGLCQAWNRGTNFYIEESHVSGKVSRADASLNKLKELNNYVAVNVHHGELSNEFLKNFNVVVITQEFDQVKLTRISEFCHENGIGFITASQLGFYGFTFVDFGKAHRIFDEDGEEAKNAIIVGISQEKTPIVSIHEDKRHGFKTGDSIRFKEIEGMTEINEKVCKITVKSPFIIQLDDIDTTNFSAYTRQGNTVQFNCIGVAEQVKVPFEIPFKKFADSLASPIAPEKFGLEILDYAKMGRPELLHITLLGLFQFFQKHNRLPELLNDKEAEILIEIVKSINKQQQDNQALAAEIDEAVIKTVAKFAQTETSPTSSFWGGIVAQEIVKYTGKFTPLRQWLHYDTFEVLPTEEVSRPIKNDSRYRDYIILLGEKCHSRLGELKAFMVGAGALGCEFLKIFSLMGLGCSNKGLLTVTDDDNIETSNLNRQFLFRKENIGQSKSECGCKVATLMNKEISVKPMKLRVDPENEQVFDDEFWDSLDIIVNAVDNIRARLFVDDRCVWYSKPLFESGTLGTKTNSQVVIPFKTQSYGDSVDPPEESIPLCTLKNFPYQIEHTIQWARDYFEGMFVEGPNECSKYIQNPKLYIEQNQRELRQKPSILRSRLETVKKLAEVLRSCQYEKCVDLARNMFQEIFNNQIKQLLFCFPKDHKTEQGVLFWSGPKRAPIAIEFNIDDPIHIEFVQSAANIFAHIMGILPCNDENVIKKILPSVKVQEYQPKKVQIKENEKDTKEEKAEDDETEILKLSQDLLGLSFKPTAAKINTIEFEKDDPTNWHIELLDSISNLRARNYSISEVTKLKVKLIAGKIIPALATTTAMICGCVALEILKYIQDKPVEAFKNAFINLALPFWIFTEPSPPIQQKDKDYDPILLGPVKAVPSGWNNWQKIDVKGPMTVAQFRDYFKNDPRYNVNLSIISSGKTCIYNSYSPSDSGRYIILKLTKRLDKRIDDLVVSISKQEIPKFKKFLQLEVSGETEDGTDATLPTVKYRIK